MEVVAICRAAYYNSREYNQVQRTAMTIMASDTNELVNGCDQMKPCQSVVSIDSKTDFRNGNLELQHSDDKLNY